jgi:hypothetical protein
MAQAWAADDGGGIMHAGMERQFLVEKLRKYVFTRETCVHTHTHTRSIIGYCMYT